MYSLESAQAMPMFAYQVLEDEASNSDMVQYVSNRWQRNLIQIM